MKFFSVKSSSETREILGNLAERYTLSTEDVGLINSIGRVTAKDIYASENLPSFNRSTVDGYAVRSLDCHGASDTIPSIFNLIGKVEMGKECLQSINNQETIYVPTGGAVPDGANAVIMIEDSEVFDESTVALSKAVADGDNIIKKGSDINRGDKLLPGNHKITPIDIGVLSSMGISKVSVYRQPVVTIISTGDEIRDVLEKKQSGEIYDINGYVLNGMLNELGVVIEEKVIVRDDYEKLYNTVRCALNRSDLILISGGSSVGTRDFTNKVIDSLPESKKFVEGISIKPGKPTIVATSGQKLIVGLPGHPVSSIVVYKVFIESYIRRLLNLPQKNEEFFGTLTENIHSSPGKTTYQMVELIGDLSNVKIKPIFGKSGMITLLQYAHGYIEIPDHKEGLEAGELVKGYYIG